MLKPIKADTIVLANFSERSPNFVRRSRIPPQPQRQHPHQPQIYRSTQPSKQVLILRTLCRELNNINSEMSLGDDSDEEVMPASLEDNYVNVDTDENGETQAARMPFSNNVLATNKSF